MRVKFKPTFTRDLRKVGNRTILRRLQEAIEQFESAERLIDLKNVRKLQGYEDFYPLRIGDYRAGLRIIGDEVEFVRFLHRKDIYRYFP